MQPNDFKYTLIVGTTDYDLIQSPIGWDENLINYKRDSFYIGMFRSFTLPLDFVTEGAKIIRSQYYQNGVESLLRLRISKLNRNTWVYEELFIGELDFTEFEDSIDRVTINVMEGGISKLIKAYDNVKYEIDLNIPEAIDVEVPGIGLDDFSNSIVQNTGGNTYYPAIDLVINELLAGLITAQNTILVNSATPNTNEYFALSNADGTLVRFKGNLQFTAQFERFGTLDASITSTIGGGAEFLVNLLYRKTSTITESVNINFDFNYIVANNQKFYLKFGSNTAGNTTDIFEGRIDISYSTVTAPINIKMISPKVLLEKILQKINGGFAVNVRSNLLSNSLVYATSGTGIRLLDNAKIKTSLKDFFRSFNAIYGIGLGIENGVIVVEDLSYFYTQIVTTASVGDVKDISISPAKDYLYSSLKIGYKEQEYEEVNGLDEFNQVQEWTFPIKKTSRNLDLTSEYRADSRGIDEIRKKLLVTDAVTTDSKSDNETFLIKLKSDLTAPEDISSFTLISGVSNPDKMYNYDLSPKRNLIRNLPFISSFLSNLNGTRILFQSGSKNSELRTIDLNGLNVKENENIEVDTILGQRLFTPIIVSFKANLPKDLQASINTTPYGAINFNYQGNSYKGFIIEASLDTSRNTEREFKLLLSSSNDLTKLIR